ncbi:MAG: RidA family protein [Actinomycetales bacterium]|nr:MAG: RidA family protein [Actinomycetales bacterium]
MTIKKINPETLAPPIGFSHAVLAEGKYIFLAGQTALNKENVIVGDTIVAQFEKALINLVTALQEAGGTPEDLVKITIFSVDPVDYRAHSREIGKTWQSLLGKNFPAMTLVGVTRLWDDKALVEIEGIACL